MARRSIPAFNAANRPGEISDVLVGDSVSGPCGMSISTITNSSSHFIKNRIIMSWIRSNQGNTICFCTDRNSYGYLLPAC